MTHWLGDILAWLDSVLPLAPRAAAEQAVLAERGQALREDRSRRPEDDPAGRWLRLPAWWQDVNAWAQQRLTGSGWRQPMKSDLQDVKIPLAGCGQKACNPAGRHPGHPNSHPVHGDRILSHAGRYPRPTRHGGAFGRKA